MVGRKLLLFKPADPVKPGTHPCALSVSPDGKTLYVALANRDAVAAIEVDKGAFAIKGYFDARLPGQSYFGAEPNTLAVNADGSRLYVANMGSNAVAVMDTRRLTPAVANVGMAEPVGFIPTEWMPISLAAVAGSHEMLYVATAKGRSTGPNDPAQKVSAGSDSPKLKRRYTYIATLVYGSLAAIDLGTVDLKTATAQVMESNRMKAAQEGIAFAGGVNPIKHVVYIIKENRTYDQIFGDLKQDGKPVGNGDPNLAMYGTSVTPNQHSLALQFGVLDNFFDSGEVELGDDHVWSNAAISSDYNEKVWQQDYRNSQRTYDLAIRN